MITTWHLIGTGIISVSGGNDNQNYGGAGGGGRIRIAILDWNNITYWNSTQKLLNLTILTLPNIISN